VRKQVVIATAVSGVAGAAAFGLVGPGQAASSDFKNKYESVSKSYDCGDGNHIDFYGPLKMWPPNHKLQDFSVVAVEGDQDPNDGTTLQVMTDITDVAGGDGGPQHDPDFVVTGGEPGGPGATQASVDFQLRSERSGKGDGRTYTINATAEFDNMTQPCATSFTVVVPHDMRGGADWK
jgi:hypothetical protein